jgi:hypothetical protein
MATEGVSLSTLEQAVLVELAAAGPVPHEMRLLARDRAESAHKALAHVANVAPLGSLRMKVAARVAAVVREEHVAGVRVRV